MSPISSKCQKITVRLKITLLVNGVCSETHMKHARQPFCPWAYNTTWHPPIEFVASHRRSRGGTRATSGDRIALSRPLTRLTAYEGRFRHRFIFDVQAVLPCQVFTENHANYVVGYTRALSISRNQELGAGCSCISLKKQSTVLCTLIRYICFIDILSATGSAVLMHISR